MSNRITGLVVGVLYLVVGALGMATNPVLGLVGTSAFGTVLHCAVGVVLVLAAALGWSKAANAIVGAVLLAAGIAGLFIISTDANVLGVNGAANLLHFATAAVLLLVGLGARK